MCSCSFLAGHKGFLSRLCFSRLHLKYSQLLFMLKQSAGINPRIWSNLPSDLKLYKDDAVANIFLMVNTHGNGILPSQYQHQIKISSSLSRELSFQGFWLKGKIENQCRVHQFYKNYMWKHTCTMYSFNKFSIHNF